MNDGASKVGHTYEYVSKLNGKTILYLVVRSRNDGHSITMLDLETGQTNGFNSDIAAEWETFAAKMTRLG